MSKIFNHPDPNGPFLGHWMSERYKRADEESRADFRALQAAKTESAKRANLQSRAIAKLAAQAFMEDSK